MNPAVLYRECHLPPPFPAQHPFPAGSHGCESSIPRVHLVLGYVQTSVFVAKGSSGAEHRSGGLGCNSPDELSSVQPHLQLCFPRYLDAPNFQLILGLRGARSWVSPSQAFSFPRLLSQLPCVHLPLSTKMSLATLSVVVACPFLLVPVDLLLVYPSPLPERNLGPLAFSMTLVNMRGQQHGTKVRNTEK